MTQRAVDTKKTIQHVYTSTVSVEKLEPNTNYTINRNIAEYTGGKWIIPFLEIPSNQEDYIETMKLLFFLASKDLPMKASDCLVLYVNIIRGSFKNLDRETKTSLIESGMECILYNQDDTENWISQWYPDMYDDDEYTNCEADHATIMVCIGIYWNFITKRLTTANIEGWLKKRRGAYATTCQIADDEESLMILSPELGFADKVNQTMASCFPFKTTVFRTIQSLSQRTTHALAPFAKITMVCFTMAELTGFSVIYDWILLKNPILLTWNGLAKHNANLIAAVNVFKSMGEDAPFCKFLYPPEKLQVFQHSKLGVYVAVAFEISMMEGKSSFKNYQGISRTDLSAELQAKCRQIVTLFGGAKTKTTRALRSSWTVTRYQSYRQLWIPLCHKI